MEDVIEILVGTSYALSFGEGALGKLNRIYDLIKEFSLAYIKQKQPFKYVSESPFGMILDDKRMSNEEKAKILLGI